MKKTTFMLVAMILSIAGAFAQSDTNNDRDLQFFRTPGFDGLNVFETPKDNDVEFKGVKVRVGGDFAIQFQGMDHSNAEGAPELIEIGNNINLPTANLNVDAQLADGVRVHLRTYLSSRHHVEAWVKGGYFQIDKLDFISEGFAGNIMDILTLRAGVDQINYGDAHFRRSDNATAIYNPFVGNYLMDAFTTEPFIEANVLPGNLIAVVGLTNGLLNPSVVKTQTSRATGQVTGVAENKVTFYGKLGYDNQLSDDFRIRLTGSIYNAPGSDNGNHLYGGDRAGGRYYKLFDYIRADSTVSTNDFSPRFNPRFSNEMAYQINPFIKFKGLEFFGVFEVTTGGNNGEENVENGQYTQLGAELLYRFGGKQQFYIGGRYNTISGHGTYATGSDEPEAVTISRINVGGGYFMTKNTLVKLEYVMQDYSENFTGALQDASASGFVVEAVLGF